MVVKGINSDLYLVNNPILVEIEQIDERSKFVEVTLRDKTNDSANQTSTVPLRLYNNGSRLRYNLGDVVKANFNEPVYPENVRENVPIYVNYAKFDIVFREVFDGGAYGEVKYFSKTFIRGGKDTRKTNLNLQVGKELLVSDKIPQWGGFPITKSYITDTKEISITKFVSIADIDRQPVVSCEPLYVRFLNSLGGYSYWLFEVSEQETQFDSMDHIENYNRITHLGVEKKISLSGETRVKREYFDLMESLMSSPEVHVYNKFGEDWFRVVVDKNSFDRNNYEDMAEVSVAFKLPKLQNNSVKW